MKKTELYNMLDNMYPFVEMDIWDKSGFFNLTIDEEVSNPIICLDINIELIDYAISINSNLIISHHPIFINEEDMKLPHIKKILEKIKSYNITIFSLHTNFDKHKYGMNYQFLKSIKSTHITKSKKSEYLYYGNLKNKISFLDFINKLNNNRYVEYILYNESDNLENIKILNIAVCLGAGSSEVFNILKKDKIDLFITGEVKWNIWNYCIDNNIKIIDIGHASEKIFIDILFDKLKPYFNNIYKYWPKIKLCKYNDF